MVFDDVYNKASDLVQALKETGNTIAFAESLTGGMISSRLVDVPGASDVLLGSVVSYTNDIKINVLGVDKETIDSFTEVSGECAAEMASGVKALTGADIAFSATGYAGDYEDHPEENQNGTVWFGFAYKDGTRSYLQHFDGKRDEVRLQAVAFVYDTVLSYLRS
ncbi:nicotinamide-nucleotide amidase [Oscillospiraceae bacterium]|nr:nicotinamide-nucleotide amidase [Oscillospiraceae bacterium]